MTSNSDFFDKSKPVLVIGGRGFVGSHIVRALIEAGIRVHVFGLPMEVDLLADLAGRFDETFGSVLDEAAIGKAIDASGAAAIVTNAAFADGKKGMMRSGDGDAKRAMEINVEGFRLTLEAARTRNIKRVIWSDSTVVYGPAALYAKDRVDESDARHPVTTYGLTKVLGEIATRWTWWDCACRCCSALTFGIRVQRTPSPRPSLQRGPATGTRSASTMSA